MCEFPIPDDQLNKSLSSDLLRSQSLQSLKDKKVDKRLICTSCAKGTRGKFKLSKVSRTKKFTCAMGKADEKLFEEYGCFKHLNNKIDLSSNEAERTFEHWLGELRRNQQSQAKKLKDLKSLAPSPMVKFYAHRNGDGRLKLGEMLIGSTIQAILDQAPKKLGLRGAARRVFTEDGTLILDIQDLMTWCVEYYRNELNKSETSKSIQKQ